MFDSGIIGVAIGLILVYFLLSLLCSGINELVEAFLRRRAKYLEGAIIDLLGLHLKDELYQHSIVEDLYSQKGRPIPEDHVPDKQRRKPSYIPAATFSKALQAILADGSARLTAEIDAAGDTLRVDATTGFRKDQEIQIHAERMRIVAVRMIEPTRVEKKKRGEKETGELEPAGELTVARGVNGTVEPHGKGARVTRARSGLPSTDLLDDLRTTIEGLRSGKLRETLGGLLTIAGPNLDQWRAEVEAWFDKKMERVSGWYGRRTRWWLFLYGVVIVVVLNADTALFARTLWGDATLRDAIVAQAETVAGGEGTQAPCEDASCVAERLQAVKALGLPLGWPDLRVADWGSDDKYADEKRVPHSTAEGALKVFGLLLTAAALAMGAPFWFDLLNKVSNIRATGRPPTPSSDESIEGGGTATP